MASVGVYEAKTHLPKLLQRVAGGERITITKHGRPIAQLVPPDLEPEMTVEEAIRGLKEFRKTHSLGGISIKELIEEGRR